MDLRAPVNVTWEITLKCNLRCAHCLSDSEIAAPDELSQLECLKLVDELTALKVFQVNIGGGEPFLHNDFLDLLNYAHHKGLVTCVSTNGIVIDNDLAKRLAKLKMLYLQVSLDGATEEVNDHIRGKGTKTMWLSASILS
jgi:MoaA/NifB/PqqE/SkfB family radical SAM enzyme